MVLFYYMVRVRAADQTILFHSHLQYVPCFAQYVLCLLREHGGVVLAMHLSISYFAHH